MASNNGLKNHCIRDMKQKETTINDFINRYNPDGINHCDTDTINHATTDFRNNMRYEKIHECGLQYQQLSGDDVDWETIGVAYQLGVANLVLNMTNLTSAHDRKHVDAR